MADGKTARYTAIMEAIFKKHYRKGRDRFLFDRDEIGETCVTLGIEPPRNFGDVLYSFRFRKSLPRSITRTASAGREWVIFLAGKAKYRFRLVTNSRILPRDNLLCVKIPDATPEIITKYAMSDEQALLAKVRYNRLIDVFLGLTTYSLQNHLRTTVTGIGQIEIDEVYAGVDQSGTHFIIPVQAKGGKDLLGVVQADQDLHFCEERFPELACRSVAAQFMDRDVIALFELTLSNDEVVVVQERHYRLVPADDITDADLRLYRQDSSRLPRKGMRRKK